MKNEELKQATDELCAKGIAKGCYQNTSALLAAVDLLTAGDIEVEKTLIDFCAYVAKRYNVVELEISAFPSRQALPPTIRKDARRNSETTG